MLEIPELLDVPVVRQQDPDACGAACFRSIYKMVVGGLSEEEAVELVHTTGLGTTPTALTKALRRAGLEVEAGEMTIGDLAAFVEEGKPIITPVQGSGDGAGNAEGHYV